MGDFEVFPKGYVPSWRQKKRPQPWWVKVPLAVSSGVSVILLLWPTASGYQIPLSMEWAAHELVGYFRLWAMGVTLTLLGVKLWLKDSRFDAVMCLLPMLALGYLASSNPFSLDHLSVFAALALSIVGWHWSLSSRLEDPKLTAMACLATGAAGVCFYQLGLGERMIGITTIATANVVYYFHVLPYAD